MDFEITIVKTFKKMNNNIANFKKEYKPIKGIKWNIQTKNTTTKFKNLIDGFTRRLDIANKRVSELEYSSTGNIKIET